MLKIIMTIYIDVVFIENLIMNFIIILTEAIVLNSLKQYFRKFLAACLASLFYIVTLFFPDVSFLQIFIGFLIMNIAFKASTIKLLIKRTILFYFISYLFGGLSFAMISFLNNGKTTIMNGVLISDFSLFKVFLCAVLGFLLIVIVLRKKKEHIFKDVIIGFNNCETCVRLLFDTGNLLREPYTDKPVVIVEKDALKSILEEKVFKNFDKILERRV